MTNKEVLDDSFPQLLSLFFSVPCDSPGSRILVTVSCVMFSSLQSGVCCTEQPHLGDELSSRVAGSLPATVVDRYSCKPPCRREGLKCKMAFGGSPSNWRSVARQSANSLSSAAVSVVHFVSPAANCSSPSLGGSCTPSSSLLSRSEALLVTCGVFSILVDCPLDFRSLLPVFPQGFPVSSVFEVAEKPSFEAEGSGGLPTVASPNLPSVGIRAAPSLHADGKPEGVRLNHLCSSLWNPVRDSSPHQPDSLFSCALVRALLPVRLHAILITHPHGLLGLPLLCELVDIRETRVLVTPPVLAAAEPALRFLRLRESRDLWLRGNRELYRDDSRRKERVYRRGGEVGSAWQAREFETKNSPPLPFSSAAVGGEASPAAKGEERSTLGVRSSPRASSLGDAGEPEDCKLNESSAFLVRTRSSGSQLLAGVGVSAQISPTMFWQQQELLNDETQQRLQIHPVSSGYCLGGANWVITTASDQRILIVGPSAFDATGDNPSSSKIVHTPEVLARMPTTCGSARGKDTEAAFSPNTKGARYPLGPDWTVLSEASLVIFFDCAPLSGSPAIPSSFLFRLLESVPAEPHRGMSSSLSVSPAAGPYAAYSTGCSRPLLGQAGHSFVSPALTSCSHNPAPHHLRRFHQPALLRYDSQNHSGSPRASDSDSRPSNSLLASSYPPSCPLLPLSSSLRELSSLVLSTVRDRRGNVLIPIDPCGLLFLETIEVLSTITSSSSALLSAVPLYCVAPGLPGLLQFAAEGVEWMEETRAERTRDLQHPRPPLRLSACFDEELLLAGKSRPGASDLSMRNRSLIAGECLADIMPLREPCVLLLSDSSLRTGECALLLEKWKDEEKHLLVCIDRRFACRGDVKRPVLSPTSSGCESSQVGYHSLAHHQYSRHTHGMEETGSCPSVVNAAPQEHVSTELKPTVMKSPTPLLAGGSPQTEGAKLAHQGLNCAAQGKTESDGSMVPQMEDGGRLLQSGHMPEGSPAFVFSPSSPSSHALCSRFQCDRRPGEEGSFAYHQQHRRILPSMKNSSPSCSGAEQTMELFGRLLWPFLLDSWSFLASKKREPSSLEPWCIPAGSSRGTGLETQAAGGPKSSKLFRIRVAVLPLDCRLDSSAVFSLLLQHQPRRVALPAPVYAQVNRAVSLEGRSLWGLTRKPKRRHASVCSVPDKSQLTKYRQSSRLVAPHATPRVSERNVRFPGAAISPERSVRGRSVDSAAGKSESEMNRRSEHRTATQRDGAGRAGTLPGAANDAACSTFTTHLESLQPNTVKEIQVEVGVSGHDAVMLRESFSVLHLEEAASNVAASSSGLGDSTNSCPELESFPQTVCTQVVPTRRIPSIDSAGREMLTRRGTIGETVSDSSVLRSEEPRLAVGFIPAGAVLRGSGGDGGAAAGKGLLTLVLPREERALDAEGAKSGSRTSDDVPEHPRTDPTDPGDTGAVNGGRKLGARESSGGEDVLLFGEYLPQQLLRALHNRGFLDAYLGPLQSASRQLSPKQLRGGDENNWFRGCDGRKHGRTAMGGRAAHTESSTVWVEPGPPGPSALSGNSKKLSAGSLGPRPELSPIERTAEATGMIKSGDFSRGAKARDEWISRKCSLYIPSLHCCVHCWDWNLTEIEAPDRSTRNLLRSVLGQLLVNLHVGGSVSEPSCIPGGHSSR